MTESRRFLYNKRKTVGSCTGQPACREVRIIILTNLKNKGMFTGSEMEIIQFILDTPDKVIHMTIRDLAKTTFSSPSTIMRILNKIGFKSYTDFRIELAQELKNKQNQEILDANYPFDKDAEMEDIIDVVAQLSESGINETKKIIDLNVMKRIVNCINKSDVIYIFGMGANSSSALEFKYKMTKLGFRVIIESDYIYQFSDALTLSKNSIAFLISYSGESSFILKLAEALKDRGIKTVAVTSYGKSTLVNYASYVIYIGNSESRTMEHKMSTFSSQAAFLYVFSLLIALVFRSDYENNRKKLEANEESIFHKYQTFLKS